MECVCFVGVGGGSVCTATFSDLPPEWMLLAARSSGSFVCVCVWVFYSQVDHGECSQVSVRCQVVTCLRVFKAAFAWMCLQPTELGAEGGGVRRQHWLWSDADCLIACVWVTEWVWERKVRDIDEVYECMRAFPLADIWKHVNQLKHSCDEWILSCSFTAGPDITFLGPSAEFYLTPFIFNMLAVH